MRSVRIRTPARLHFGLFADGRRERKFGGVGMAIDKPGFDLTVQFNEVDHIYSWIDPSLHGRISKLLETLRSHFDVPPVRIDVDEFIPHHVGLGSGTQLALAVGNAVAKLLRIPISQEEMTTLVRRGMRSGIGHYAFYGHSFMIESSKSDGERIAPLSASLLFPLEWRVVLIQAPLPPGVHGLVESEAFRDRIVIPEETTDRLCRIVLLEVVPSLQEGDCRQFGESLYAFNRLSGECYAAVQGGVYAHPRLEAIVRNARNLGCTGVGQSSWGPTLFAIHPSKEAARSFVDRLTDLHPDIEMHIVTGRCPDSRETEPQGTQLLVSARTSAEAKEAVAGGIDILDVKEPSRGPLGSADPEVRNEIIDLLVPYCHGDLRRLPQTISLAFGELSQLECRGLREDEGPRRVDDLGHPGIILVKVGFAGERSRTDWAERFLRLRPRTFSHSRWEFISEYIPVAYADDPSADSPNWREIVDRICKKREPWNCRLLVDTFSKQTDFWNALGRKEGVRELFDVCKKERIDLALAGSMKIDDLDRLADEIGELPAVVAVRGAVCKDGIRTNPIDRERVAAFRRRLIAVETSLGRNRPSCG